MLEVNGWYIRGQDKRGISLEEETRSENPHRGVPLKFSSIL